MKTCSKCRQSKPFEYFGSNVRRPDSKNHWCKSCQNTGNAINKAKKKLDAVQWRRTCYGYELKANFNMYIEDYDLLFAAQKGVCKICEKPSTNFLSVDHEHSTGMIRGLLCNQCNLMLGNGKDHAEILRRGALYLEDRSEYHYY